MKTETRPGQVGSQSPFGLAGAPALPSTAIAESMGFAKACAGLTAPQAVYLRNVLSFHWQPGGPGLPESCRLATLECRRIARLDQGVLARCRKSRNVGGWSVVGDDGRILARSNVRREAQGRPC